MNQNGKTHKVYLHVSYLFSQDLMNLHFEGTLTSTFTCLELKGFPMQQLYKALKQ